MNMAGKMRKTSGNSILIGAFCAISSAAALRRFRISSAIVPHDVAHRDAERLALDDRAREERDAARVGALLEVHERLVDGQAHVLLLQRQPQLLAERAADPVGCRPHCRREAEAGLDRDDEEVDQLGQLVLDLVVALPDPPAHDEENGEPADDHRADREEDDDHGRCRCGDRQPERQDAEPGGDEHLVAEQAVG